MGLWPYKFAGDVVPVLATEVCRIRRGTASSILITPAVDQGQYSASRPGSCIPGKELWHAFSRRLGMPQSLSGLLGEGKKNLLLLGLELGIVQPIR
jgi:hypothetical protein